MAKRPQLNDGEDGPQRTCLVTREKGDRAAMVRFVLSPEGVVTPDIRARLPGRGVWIKASRVTISVAIRKKLFDRGFREAAKVDADLPAQVERLIEDDALQMLALANKAGVVVTGFGKVEDELGAGRAAVVLHATDSAADGVRKLDQAAHRGGRTPARVKLFEAGRLGLALGRPHVVHAALAPGAAGEAFLGRCRRLQNFRGDATDEMSGHSPGPGANERTQ